MCPNRGKHFTPMNCLIPWTTLRSPVTGPFLQMRLLRIRSDSTMGTYLGSNRIGNFKKSLRPLGSQDYGQQEQVNRDTLPPRCPLQSWPSSRWCDLLRDLGVPVGSLLLVQLYHSPRFIESGFVLGCWDTFTYQKEVLPCSVWISFKTSFRIFLY